MHEFSVATGILDRATEAAREHDATRIDALTVAVGRATHVNPTQLKFCIEAVAADSIASEASVSMKTIEPAAECECGWEGTPASLDESLNYVPDTTCPECDAPASLVRGRECRLSSITVPDSNTTDTAEPRSHD